MASVGHVVVGMAAARFSRHRQVTTWTPFGAAVLWSGLSLLPDADAFGFRFGIHYEDPWGHRGATHSFAFALGIALLAMAVAKAARLRVWRTALITLVVVASHPILDTLTDGGLGCALLWPHSDERFFAPWTPLPVAPIGRAYLSREGLRVAAVELLALAPLLAYALWPAVKWCRARPWRRHRGDRHDVPR
jgi:inner membrane protein